MIVYIFNKPTCADFNLSDIENLKLNGLIDHFDILENNSKIVFYWRGLKEKERRQFNFSLYKRYSFINCIDRTHEIYLYYDKKGSVIFDKVNN